MTSSSSPPLTRSPEHADRCAAADLQSSVLTGPSSRPSGGIILGPEGVGKTSLGACAKKPIVIMLGGEVGLETLIGAGRVPPTPRRSPSWTHSTP